MRLHPREQVLQALKREQKTPEFREKYRQRAHIERTNCDLKRHGAGKARYIGRIKVKFQLINNGGGASRHQASPGSS